MRFVAVKLPIQINVSIVGDDGARDWREGLSSVDGVQDSDVEERDAAPLDYAHLLDATVAREHDLDPRHEVRIVEGVSRRQGA